MHVKKAQYILSGILRANRLILRPSHPKIEGKKKEQAGVKFVPFFNLAPQVKVKTGLS